MSEYLDPGRRYSYRVYPVNVKAKAPPSVEVVAATPQLTVTKTRTQVSTIGSILSITTLAIPTHIDNRTAHHFQKKAKTQE